MKCFFVHFFRKSFGFCLYSLDAFGKTDIFKPEVKEIRSAKEKYRFTGYQETSFDK